MTKPLDLTGNKYGRYTVIERTSNSKAGKTRWVCLCECGNQGIVVGSDLKTGKAKNQQENGKLELVLMEKGIILEYMKILKKRKKYV